MPLKRATVEKEVQTNETMKDLNETKDELERMRKTLLRTEDDRMTGICGGGCLRIATRNREK